MEGSIARRLAGGSAPAEEDGDDGFGQRPARHLYHEENYKPGKATPATAHSAPKYGFASRSISPS